MCSQVTYLPNWDIDCTLPCPSMATLARQVQKVRRNPWNHNGLTHHCRAFWHQAFEEQQKDSACTLLVIHVQSALIVMQQLLLSGWVTLLCDVQCRVHTVHSKDEPFCVCVSVCSCLSMCWKWVFLWSRLYGHSIPQSVTTRTLRQHGALI